MQLYMNIHINSSKTCLHLRKFSVLSFKVRRIYVVHKATEKKGYVVYPVPDITICMLKFVVVLIFDAMLRVMFAEVA